MPGVARKSGTDTVASPDGTGFNCASPTTQATNVGSDDVIVNGVGAIRQGDAMKTHPAAGCGLHAPTLSSFSSTVIVNGKGVGRLGDAYNGHVVTSASSDVIAG